MKNIWEDIAIFWSLVASTTHIWPIDLWGQIIFFPQNQMIYTSIDAKCSAEQLLLEVYSLKCNTYGKSYKEAMWFIAVSG